MGDDTARVRLLGGVSIERSRSEEPLNPRLRRLLAVLSVDRGETVSESALIDAVWGESDELPANPTRSLQTYVSRLRSHLGAEAVERVGAGYRLAEGVSTDVVEFEALLGEAREARSRADDRSAVDLLERANGLWDGPALGDLADESWAGAQAHRLDELRVDAREQRAELLIGLGDVNGALLGDLKRLAIDHPHREGPTRLLMIALNEVGRQADALTAFRRHRDQLATDLGLEPSPGLRKLEEQILTEDPAARTAGSGRALRGYRIRERLGEGAFSIVYRGEQPSVGREVAIKQIRAELANRPEFIRRFETEAHLVARLEHPHIVPLIDYWREPGSAYLVMRLLRGGNLETSVLEHPWTLDRTLAMVDQIGAGLAVAHRAGVVHRDVKSANILLDDESNAYLSDFGIALEASEIADPLAALSAGSPAYASPEQLRREPIGPPADVHGLAIAVYEALTGRLPFPDEPNQAALLQRQLHDPIPPVRHVRSDLPTAIDDVLGRATAKAPTDRYQTVEEFVEALHQAANVSGPAGVSRAAMTAITAEVRNPYKGLRAFDEADAADFAGRERLVDQLAETLDQNRLIAVVGPSGSGKSSVVRAGLLPQLRKGRLNGSDRWYVVTMVPGQRPFEELENGLTRISTNSPMGLLELLRDGERGIGRSVRRVLPDDGQLLLVIDQFEELFTLCEDETARREFLDGLASAVTEERSRLRVILTLRADFYDRPLRYESIGRLVRDATIPILPLAADELERAIVDPALRVGCEFEPGLISEIVADVADQPGALPMLQYALTELYERRVSGLLLKDAYRDLGGVAGALARRAEELHSEAGSDEQTAIRAVFGRLVTPGEGTEDTRRRALRSELTSISRADTIIDLYGAARLVSFDHDPATREPTVEVAHEALIRQWPRLREWLDEDRDGLRIMRHLHTAAHDWDATGRPDTELYRGGRLETAEDWASEHGHELTELETSFLQASTDQRAARQQADRRANRRLRRLLAAVGVVAVLALISGVVAFQQSADARGQRAVAEENAAEAETSASDAESARFSEQLGRMSADASALVDDNRVVALLLAAEAYRIDENPTTLGALQSVLANTGPFLGLIGSGTPTSGVWWLDDDRLLGAGPSGVSVYDRRTGEATTITDDPVAHRRLQRLDSQRNEFPLVSVASSASILAYVPESMPDTVKIVSLVDDGPEMTLDHPSQIDAIVVDAGGDRVATLDFDGVARIYDAGSGESIVEVLAHPEKTPDDQTVEPDVVKPDPGFIWLLTDYPGYVRFLPSGELMTTRLVDTRIFDSESGELLIDSGFAMPALGNDLRARWASGMSTEFADESVLWNFESSIAAHNLLTGERLGGNKVPGTGLVAGTPKVVATAPGSDAATAWVLINDGRVLRVDVSTGDVFETVQTRLNEASALSVSPDGRVLAVSGLEGIALLSADGNQLLAVAGVRGLAEDPTLSADGRRVAGSNGDLNFPMPYFEVRTDRLEQIEVDFLEPFDQPFFAYDSARPMLIRYARGSKVSLQDQATLEPLTQLDNSRNWSMGATSLNDAYFLIGDSWPERHELTLYETNEGQPVASYPIDERVAFTGSIHPDGDRAIVAFLDGPPVMLSIPNLELMNPPSDLGDIAGARWSNDGRYLFTIDRSRRVTLRDPDTFEPLRPLEGSRLTDHLTNLTVYSIGDGEMILSAVNAAPQLWDAATGQAIGGPFPTDNGLGFDGHDNLDKVVTGVGDHFLVWNLDTSTWRDIACQAAGRNLSLEEWRRWGPQGEDYRATCDQWPPPS